MFYLLLIEHEECEVLWPIGAFVAEAYVGWHEGDVADYSNILVLVRVSPQIPVVRMMRVTYQPASSWNPRMFDNYLFALDSQR
jgi:hypothetical protein